MTPPSPLRLLPAFLLIFLLMTPAAAQETGIVQKLYENALQLLRTGKPTEALKGFEQIYVSYGKSPQAPDALFQAATFHYATSELDDIGLAGREAIQKAVPLLDRIRREYGTSSRAPDALYRLGLIALEPENPRANTNEAYAAFTSVANVYPDSPLVGTALYGAAVSQMRSEAFDAAIEDFSRLFEQEPDFAAGAKARLNFGYSLFRSDDFPRAMEEYQKVRELYPGKPEAQIALERLTLLHRLRLDPAAGRPRTYRLDSSFGGKLQALGIKSLDSMAIDPDGNLLLGDGRAGAVVKVDSSGKVIGTIPLPDLRAVASDSRGAIVAAGGGILVVGTRQQPLVRPDDSSTRPVKEFAGLAVDRDGRVLVGDARTGEVLLFGRGLDFKAAIHRTSSGRLADVRVGFDNQVYVLDSKERTISVYSDGKAIAHLRLYEPPASVSIPVDMAVDELGDLYVCDGASGRVVVLGPSGKRVLGTLVGDRSKGGLSDPQRVEVDRQGRIYIYDKKADAILRYQ